MPMIGRLLRRQANFLRNFVLVGLNKRYRKRVFENIPKTLDISGAGEGIRNSPMDSVYY